MHLTVANADMLKNETGNVGEEFSRFKSVFYSNIRRDLKLLIISFRQELRDLGPGVEVGSLAPSREIAFICLSPLGETASHQLQTFFIEKGIFPGSFSLSLQPAKETQVTNGRVYALEGHFEPWVQERVDYLHDYR